MSTAKQLRFDFRKLLSHSLGDANPLDCEPTMATCHAAHVRKAQEVKRFRTPLAASLAAIGREATELDQTRFVSVKLQAELGQPPVEIIQTSDCFVTVLKADDEIIRIANDHDITTTAFASPRLYP
jgi:hypothetical protein